MKFIDILKAISVAIIWGMGFVFAKAAINHFPPILLMAFRFALTAAVLVWFFKPPVPQLKQLFWIALISAAVQYSLTFNGLKGIDASTAALIVQLEVPFGTLLAWLFLGDKMRIQHFVGIGLAFVGTYLISGSPSLEGNLVYVLLVIGGAFTWAIGQIMLKKLGNVGGFTLITWVAIMATPQLFIASWIFESGQIEAIVTAPPIVWITVAYLGLIMTALGYAMWYGLLGQYDANQVFPFLLLLPVTSVIGGGFFLGEVLDMLTLVGGALSISGVALITIQFKRRRATA